MTRRISAALVACSLIALSALAIGTLMIGAPRHSALDLVAPGRATVACVAHSTYAICDTGETGTRTLRERHEDGTWVMVGAVTVPQTYTTANDDVAPLSAATAATTQPAGASCAAASVSCELP